jgi:hypothetical protein
LGCNAWIARPNSIIGSAVPHPLEVWVELAGIALVADYYQMVVLSVLAGAREVRAPDASRTTYRLRTTNHALLQHLVKERMRRKKEFECRQLFCTFPTPQGQFPTTCGQHFCRTL